MEISIRDLEYANNIAGILTCAPQNVDVLLLHRKRPWASVQHYKVRCKQAALL